MKGTPSFQYYPQDFLSDVNVAAMSSAQVGAYWLLISHIWIEGSIPNDDKLLAKISRLGRHWTRNRETIIPLFEIIGCPPNDRIVHRRLEKERHKQSEFRKKRKFAAESRWGRRDASASDMQCLSSSSLPLVSKNKTKKDKDIGDKGNNLSEFIGGDKVLSVAYKEFREYRKEIRKKLTPTSENRLQIKLERISAGNTVAAKEILVQTMENSWTGIFPITSKGITYASVMNGRSARSGNPSARKTGKYVDPRDKFKTPTNKEE